MSNGVDRFLLTIDEGAQVLSIGRSFMYKLVMRGEIASLKIGRTRRVSRDAILEFIRRIEAEQADEEVSG